MLLPAENTQFPPKYLLAGNLHIVVQPNRSKAIRIYTQRMRRNTHSVKSVSIRLTGKINLTIFATVDVEKED